jgi:hypothetical protein
MAAPAARVSRHASAGAIAWLVVAGVLLWTTVGVVVDWRQGQVVGSQTQQVPLPQGASGSAAPNKRVWLGVRPGGGDVTEGERVAGAPPREAMLPLPIPPPARPPPPSSKFWQPPEVRLPQSNLTFTQRTTASEAAVAGEDACGGLGGGGCVPSRQHHLAHQPLRLLLPHAEWGGNPAFVRTLHEGLQRGSAGNPGGVAFLTMVNAAWLEMLEHLLYTALLHGGIKVRRPRSGMRCGAASPSLRPWHPSPTHAPRADPHPLLSHPRPLLTHPRPLLSHPRPLLSHPHSLLTHPRPLLSHSRPLRDDPRLLSNHPTPLPTVRPSW